MNIDCDICGTKGEFDNGDTCRGCDGRGYTVVPDKPLDFLGRELHPDDWIVYPTGGTSARMVLARIKRIDTLEPDKHVWNGLMGQSQFRLVVNRHKEGDYDTTSESYWKVDESREVRVDQLHRVVIVPKVVRYAR
jgi:hypothetical protein